MPPAGPESSGSPGGETRQPVLSLKTQEGLACVDPSCRGRVRRGLEWLAVASMGPGGSFPDWAPLEEAWSRLLDARVPPWGATPSPGSRNA